MNAPPPIEKAAEWVRRARSGDEVAMACLTKIGEMARKGTPQQRAMVKPYFDRAMQEINGTPPRRWSSIFGSDSKKLDSAPILSADEKARAARVQPNGTLLVFEMAEEDGKPPVPKGTYDRILEPEAFGAIVIKALKFRNGLDGAAVALAAGPPLVAERVQEMGMSGFGSDETSAAFFHGVRFSGEDDYAKVAPKLDGNMRRCVVIGQCVGRARRIQIIRSGAPLGGVVGWELGE